jgi:LacI family transcriptional regulator
VAARAGVSAATASRVFGGNDRVDVATRARVLEAAEELGYVVNGLARSMMGRGPRTIAFLVHHMVGPTFASMASGVESVATENGFLFLLGTTHGDPDRERELIDTLREQRAAAILLVGSSDSGEGFSDRAASYAKDLDGVGARLIFCGRPPLPGHPEITSVGYDQVAAVSDSVGRAIALGHRSIAYIGVAPGMTTPELRLDGYRQALLKGGIEWDPARVCASDNDEDSGHTATLRLLDSGVPVTAIVCMTDIIAIGVYRALRERGLRIPEDVSVVGFDDLPIVGDLTPGLTTVRPPYREIGIEAARVAIGLRSPHENVELATSYVERGSLAAPPA